MSKHTFFRRTLTAAMASLIAAAALAGCAAGGASGGSKGLEASFGFAEAKVKDYSSGKARLSAVFSDKAFSTANAAAMMINAKSTAEDLEKIARYLFLDSITFTDDTGKVIASYPKGEEGKLIKEVEGKQTFNRVVKGVVVKTMTDPAPTTDGTAYTLLAGVSRMDAGGAVVVGFTTEDYAAVTGEKLADSCGVNTVILSNGKILSSTLEKAEAGKDLASLGIKDEDIAKGSFEMTVGDAKYQCKAETIDEFVLISAEPA